MFKALWKKITEATVSVLPVAAIVILLNCTPLVSFTGKETAVFICSAVLLIVGMALFNLGADVAMTPMGEQIGTGLSKSGKFKLLLSICFLMGVFVTIAEPDLSVLASQVKEVVSSTVLTVSIGVGVGLFLVLSVLKIVFRISLAQTLTFCYLILFALVALGLTLSPESFTRFLPLAFDSGGVTTGPITVPFLMALGVGVSSALGDKRDRESSFGFIGLCSIGPILAVTLLGVFSKGQVDYVLPDYGMHLNAVGTTLLHTLKNVAVALGPIVAFYFVLQAFVIRAPKRQVARIGVGIGYTFVGLVIFLAAVEIGFMPVGFKMGEQLAALPSAATVAIAFALGFVVVLAEPAIHVLKKQVETVTGGAISKRAMLIALSVGVGLSIGLSVLRVYCGFSVLYYLIPGYILSLGLSFFVPKIYTAIAFDSGGVASGPLTSTFILPFVIGICSTLSGASAVLTDAFGLVAMVAMTPLITIQTLGFKAVVTKRVKEKIAMKRILDADDEQIIRFM